MPYHPIIPDIDEELVRAVSMLASDAATIHALKNDIGVYVGTVETLHLLAAAVGEKGVGAAGQANFQRRLEIAEQARLRLRMRLTEARLSADPFPAQ